MSPFLRHIAVEKRVSELPDGIEEVLVLKTEPTHSTPILELRERFTTKSGLPHGSVVMSRSSKVGVTFVRWG